MFLEVSHNLQENTCTRVLQASATLLKKSLWHRCFPVNFVKFLTTLFTKNNSGGCFGKCNWYIFGNLKPVFFKDNAAQKMKLFIKDFFSKLWPNPQKTADLVTFIEEILNAGLVTFTEETLNGKLYFLCSATVRKVGKDFLQKYSKIPRNTTTQTHTWYKTQTPLIRGCKFNVYKTFRRRPGRFQNVLFICAIYTCCVRRKNMEFYLKGVIKTLSNIYDGSFLQK